MFIDVITMYADLKSKKIIHLHPKKVLFHGKLGFYLNNESVFFGYLNFILSILEITIATDIYVSHMYQNCFTIYVFWQLLYA